ncbi:MAG: PAS domain-containing sensor histidine kinase [Hyphomicrobiales bacterium]
MVRALYKLPDFERGLLYVYRKVDQTVVDHLARTRERRAEYEALADARAGVQAAFALLYVGMALIFLLAAVWFGLWVANRLVAPIGRLINAARRVSAGDLSVTVDINQREGDVASLARTFNKMTGELNSQRKELLAANTTLDERRRFMEAVLTGVTAGIVGLNPQGRIELINRSALELLDLSLEDVVGEPLGDVVPEFSNLINAVKSRPGRPAEAQVSLVINGNERTVHARITSEADKGGQNADGTRSEENIGDLVVTFDDITELQTAQRSSAWADIARRIAHEIKNPLTPIQLSAERLKRKYSKHIETDREIFEQCTDTIIRQVGDIGRMVDEFSSFARMPKANFESGNLNQVVRDAVILQKMALQNIEFEVRLPDEPLEFSFDRRLVTQALTNLIKNASEAIESAELNGDDHGLISVVVERRGRECAVVSVIDNGCGLPKKDRNRLTEPYMTTRENGTGLGLAIVRRIIEEHGGTITLKDAAESSSGRRGAVLTLEFPFRETAEAADPRSTSPTKSLSNIPAGGKTLPVSGKKPSGGEADKPDGTETQTASPGQDPIPQESD